MAFLFRLGPGSSLLALVGAVALTARAVDAGHHAAAMSPEPVYDPSWRTGASIVAAFPPAWALVALLLAGVLTRVGSRTWDSRSTSAT